MKASHFLSSQKQVISYEEKFDLIISALVEARKIPRNDTYATRLYISESNGLNQFGYNEIDDILRILEGKTIIDVYRGVLPCGIRITNEITDHSCFDIDILDNFDKWLNNYLVVQKANLENVDQKKTTKSINNNIGTNNIENKRFRFDEYIFYVRLISGKEEPVVFTPQGENEKLPNSYYLLKVLVDYLDSQDALSIKIGQNELLDLIKSKYLQFKDEGLDWLNNTKNNLKKKLSGIKEVVVMGDLDKVTKEYSFSIKISA